MKAHKWFKGVDWQMVLNRKVPAPWRPNIKNETDTHYFDKYPETHDESLSLREDEQDLFNDF
ncbi:MAG: hypothetical protein P4M11_08330 [Candidatus Pacebacteria bacterium]|nr:hypothetical protein [Candidatus Paceibacterota bacterium]